MHDEEPLMTDDGSRYLQPDTNEAWDMRAYMFDRFCDDSMLPVEQKCVVCGDGFTTDDETECECEGCR